MRLQQVTGDYGNARENRWNRRVGMDCRRGSDRPKRFHGVPPGSGAATIGGKLNRARKLREGGGEGESGKRRPASQIGTGHIGPQINGIPARRDAIST